MVKDNSSKLTLAHLADGLVGVRTLGGLTRQHDTVSTVSDGVANVANLSTSGSGVLDHALEHLGGANDGLAGNVAHGNHLLLGSKHLGGGNLDTQVTTSDHDTVSLLENLREVVQTLPVLNLGNDLDVLALLAKNLTDGLDVLATADKRGKDHVDIVLDTESQVVLVLLGQGWKVDIGVGQVDTLSRRDETVVLGADADGLVIDDVEDLKGQDTVVDVDDATLLNDLGNVLVVDIHVLGVAGSLVLVVGGDVQLGTSRERKVGITDGVSGSDFLDTHILSTRLSLSWNYAECTYRSLGVQGNGNLATRLGRLGGTGIVDDRLVVRVLALQVCVSGPERGNGKSLASPSDVRERSSCAFSCQLSAIFPLEIGIL